MGEKTLMATNNFKPFATGNNANVTTQADYEALAALATGFQSGKASSAQINKALRQSTTITSVLAQYIANTSGADVLDNGDTAGMLANLLLAIQQSTKNYAPQVVTGVVGTSRNLAMNVTAASATATITADEIVVENALGGNQYRIGSFSKTINLSTTGAGGMDTGTVPANGFVAIYAIFNSVTKVSALLAVNTTASVAPEIYSGANMPSGFTASALVSVWPIVSSQFNVGLMVDREISYPPGTVLSTSVVAPSFTAASIAGAVPPNARFVKGTMQCGSTESSALVFQVSSDSNGTAASPCVINSPGAGNVGNSLPLMPIKNQMIYYKATSSAGTPIFIIGVTGYSF